MSIQPSAKHKRHQERADQQENDRHCAASEGRYGTSRTHLGVQARVTVGKSRTLWLKLKYSVRSGGFERMTAPV
jgi:hypothetical protein